MDEAACAGSLKEVFHGLGKEKAVVKACSRLAGASKAACWSQRRYVGGS